MYEIGEHADAGDGCWRTRYGSPDQAVRALRRSAQHRVDGSLSYYLDISGHDGDGDLRYRIVPVLHVLHGRS